MGTVFGGYLLNVNQSTVTVTDYEYVTDVSSLFQYNQQPDYIEYNPAKNFTGYQLTDGSGLGIDYVEASSPNQYLLYSDSVSTITLDLSIFNSDTNLFDTSDTANVYRFDSTTVFGTRHGWTDGKLFDANKIIQHLTDNNMIPANTTYVTLKSKNSSTMVGFGTDNNISTKLDVYDYSTYYYPNLSKPYQRSWNACIDNGSIMNRVPSTPSQTTLTYDISSTNWTINANGSEETLTKGLIAYPTNVSQGIKIDFYTEGGLGDWSWIITQENLSAFNTQIEVEFHYDTITHYLNPSKGVRINNTDNSLKTVWSNGKNNSRIQIVVEMDSSMTHGNTMWLNTDLDYNYIIFQSNSSGNVEFFVRDSHINIGNWEHFIIDIDAINGKVYVVPIIEFVNFQSFTTADYTIDVGSLSGSMTVNKIMWSRTSSVDYSSRFSVYSTDVQMTTKLIMIDPSMNIKNYFPLQSGFKMDLKSFTVLGDSLTINNITMYGDANGNPINQTGNIYYSSGDDEWTIKMDRLVITEDALSGHTYLSDGRIGGKVIDLGSTVSSTVTGSGTWFFTDDLYEGFITTGTHYDWDWQNTLTSTQSILIWLGLVVVCSIFAHKYFDFKMMDIAIVVGASVILYAILGVF